MREPKEFGFGAFDWTGMMNCDKSVFGFKFWEMVDSELWVLLLALCEDASLKWAPLRTAEKHTKPDDDPPLEQSGMTCLLRCIATKVGFFCTQTHKHTHMQWAESMEVVTIRHAWHSP